MKRWTWLLAAGLAATTLPFAATAQADDKSASVTPTSLDEIPPAARDALVREAGGAPIIDVQQETDNGSTVYEAHVRKGNAFVGIEVDAIRVDASGKVMKGE